VVVALRVALDRLAVVERQAAAAEATRDLETRTVVVLEQRLVYAAGRRLELVEAVVGEVAASRDRGSAQERRRRAGLLRVVERACEVADGVVRVLEVEQRPARAGWRLRDRGREMRVAERVAVVGAGEHDAVAERGLKRLALRVEARGVENRHFRAVRERDDDLRDCASAQV